MNRITKILGAVLVLTALFGFAWQSAQAGIGETKPIKYGVSAIDSVRWIAAASTDSTTHAGYIAKGTKFFKTVSTGADTSEIIDGRNAHLRSVMWITNNHGGSASTGTIDCALWLQGNVGMMGTRLQNDSTWVNLVVIDSFQTATTPDRLKVRYKTFWQGAARDTAASVYPLLRFIAKSWGTSVDTTRGVVVPYFEYPPTRDALSR